MKQVCCIKCVRVNDVQIVTGISSRDLDSSLVPAPPSRNRPSRCLQTRPCLRDVEGPITMLWSRCTNTRPTGQLRRCICSTIAAARIGPHKAKGDVYLAFRPVTPLTCNLLRCVSRRANNRGRTGALWSPQLPHQHFLTTKKWRATPGRTKQDSRAGQQSRTHTAGEKGGR